MLYELDISPPFMAEKTDAEGLFFSFKLIKLLKARKDNLTGGSR